MAQQQKDNSGVLFTNDRKERDNQPDRRGSALIDGVEYWVSAWSKPDRNGNTYFSLAFTRKDKATQSAPVHDESTSESEDSDVPF